MTQGIRTGGRVAIVATSSPLRPKDFELTPGLLAETARGLGFIPVLSESLYASTECGFSIAPPQMRADDLMRAFTDPDIDFIWCAIGGSTAMQLLPLLDYKAIRNNPKPLIGMSDVTPLLDVISERSGIVTYHGPTIRQFVQSVDAEALQSLLTAVNSEGYTFSNPQDFPIRTLVPGTCSGVLKGGNLTMVCALMGTPYQPDFRNAVLYLEETGEAVYRLERMLRQLQFAGVFEMVSGVLFGESVNCINRYNPDYDADRLLQDFFADYDKPVLYNIKSGHRMPTMTLPIGKRARVSGAEDGQGSLEFIS